MEGDQLTPLDSCFCGPQCRWPSLSRWCPLVASLDGLNLFVANKSVARQIPLLRVSGAPFYTLTSEGCPWIRVNSLRYPQLTSSWSFFRRDWYLMTYPVMECTVVARSGPFRVSREWFQASHPKVGPEWCWRRGRWGSWKGCWVWRAEGFTAIRHRLNCVFVDLVMVLITPRLFGSICWGICLYL